MKNMKSSAPSQSQRPMPRSTAPSQSQRPMPRPSKLAPSKSKRPKSREDGLNQLRLDQAAKYAGEPLKRAKGGMVSGKGCGSAVKGKKYSGTF